MRKHITTLLTVMLLMACLISAFKTGDKKPFLKTGTWRAVLQRPDGQQIVFNFTTAVPIPRNRGSRVRYLANTKNITSAGNHQSISHHHFYR